MKPSRSLIVALSIAASILAVLAGIGVYGLLTGPPDQHDQAPTPAAPTDAPALAPNIGDSPLTPITVTDDAQTFARMAAQALFEWDTTRITTPTAIVEHLMATAEPSGIEAHGLYQDVQSYLPTIAQWRQLRQYETRQHLDIRELFIPESWPAILADPGNDIGKDVTAVTVDGVRIREGGWHGQETIKESPVSFTLFISCPSDADRCYLLRLSALDLALR